MYPSTHSLHSSPDEMHPEHSATHFTQILFVGEDVSPTSHPSTHVPEVDQMESQIFFPIIKYVKIKTSN